MKALTILYLISVMFCNKFQLVPNQKGEACQRRTRILTAIRLRWALSPLQFLLAFLLTLAIRNRQHGTDSMEFDVLNINIGGVSSQDVDGEPLASDDDMDQFRTS